MHFENNKNNKKHLSDKKTKHCYSKKVSMELNTHLVLTQTQ